jgi:hypothetical protein
LALWELTLPLPYTRKDMVKATIVDMPSLMELCGGRTWRHMNKVSIFRLYLNQIWPHVNIVMVGTHAQVIKALQT